jgi:antitoxin HigA-1
VLGDLAAPPRNRLESLKDELAGYHSIRINDQWRIVFRWTDVSPEDIEIVDYHHWEERLNVTKKLPPVRPGEVLREEFLGPMNLTPYSVAKALGVPRTRIERLVREETALTADTALRLARYFGTSAAFWLGMQSQFDLERAADELGPEIGRIEPIKAA